jgi:HPt (histidine-containing phosphotransfer) domain-containing protein
MQYANYIFRNDSSKDTSNAINGVRSWAHFLKGTSNTIGMIKVRDLAREIQAAAGDASLAVEETIRTITQALGELKDAFVEADRKYRIFYREAEREIDWQQPMEEQVW